MLLAPERVDRIEDREECEEVHEEGSLQFNDESISGYHWFIVRRSLPATLTNQFRL